MDEQRRDSTRRLAVALGVMALAVIGISIFFWLWSTRLDKSPQQASTPDRSQQLQGSSTVAKQASPPPNASSTNTSPETVGHAQDVAHSASGQISLTEDQRKAIDEFAQQHKSRVIEPNFTVSVGAAVPKQIELGDLPVGLTDKLAAYSGDQFLLVPSSIVVVERDTRRIVAIVPIS
jgi:hypothetical protein